MTEVRPQPTIRAAEVVYGIGGPDPDDPAELFHEASSAYPSFAGRQAAGVRLLEARPELRVTASRSVKRHANLPTCALPEPRLPSVGFAELVAARCSERSFGARPLDLVELATILHAAYGVTHEAPAAAGNQLLRGIPSGGALYPLELYVAAARIEGLEPGLHHFDPLARSLERIRVGDVADELLECMIFRAPAAEAAAVLVVTAMFWRTRFKYGLRGYRFALLEAGHLVQNALLAALGLGLGSVPIGGFYDRPLASFLGVDGVNEAPLYLVCVGHRP